MSVLGKIAHMIFGSTVGKKKYQRFWQGVYHFALKGMNVGNGGSFDESGEKEALCYLRRDVFSDDSPVIFDVGANVGGYTMDVLSVLPDARMHCFEPSRDTFEQLKKNVQSDKVTFNNFGISDATTEATLYCNSDSGLASLFQRQFDENSNVKDIKSETIRLDTIDNYCGINEIDHIDLLKLDIEGNEINALNGAANMLNSQKIKAIQIEFGGCNLDSRTYFRDYWNLLSENYYVYRILIDGLQRIDTYYETMELFHCTNYLFVKKIGM